MERREGLQPVQPSAPTPDSPQSNISDSRSNAAHEALKNVQGAKKEMSADVRKALDAIALTPAEIAKEQARQATELAKKEAIKSEKRVGENERIAELIKQINETPAKSQTSEQAYIVEKTSITDTNAWDEVQQQVEASAQSNAAPAKKGLWAKTKRLFGKLFGRKNKWERLASSEGDLDLMLAEGEAINRAAKADAASDAYAAKLEANIEKPQGSVRMAAEGMAAGLQKGLDATRQVGAKTPKIKEDKWSRIANDDAALELADMDNTAREVKQAEDAQIYADQLELNAEKPEGMAESVINQTAEAARQGMDNLASIGARNLDADKQPFGNNAKVERALADMEGMDDDDVAVEKFEHQMNETLAANAKGQAYADKLEAKAARGAGMVESVVGDAAEALQSGMDTITDFVYKGRNMPIMENIHEGANAKERISDIVKNIPAREYKALLKGIDEFGDNTYTGGQAKERIKDIMQNAPEDQIFTLMQSLSPDSTVRDLAQSIAKMRDAE